MSILWLQTYYYDSYGNLTSTSVYNDDATDKEYLTTTYDYGSR
ncbi:MAG: hypothetical protein ACLUG4_08740 [Bacilli bacterium]